MTEKARNVCNISLTPGTSADAIEPQPQKRASSWQPSQQPLQHSGDLAIRKYCSLFLASLALAASSSTASPARSVMTHHIREATRTGEARLVGHKPSSETMNLDLALPLRGPAGLKSFLVDLYKPASPSFHHHLTPAEFTAQFGPTQAQYDEVLAFAGMMVNVAKGAALGTFPITITATGGAQTKETVLTFTAAR